MAEFGKLGRALTLAGAVAASPALAEDADSRSLQLAAMTNDQVTDCVGFVREQRDLAAENNIAMSRRDQITLLNQCESGILQERIAEQEAIIVDLNEQIAHLQIRVDENGRIIDEQGRELARLIAINGQLILRRQEVQAETAASRARQDEMLREAERILQSLAVS